jgi:hypothetical protein
VALAFVIIVINIVTFLLCGASACAATEVPPWLLRLRATQLLQPLLLLLLQAAARPECCSCCATAVGAAGRSATRMTRHGA